MVTSTIHDARAIAETVSDPELPMLTLADLGVLRSVTEHDGTIIVEITPTYTGCPAMDAMRDDLVRVLHNAGYPDVEIRVVLSPSWTSDWITDNGRRKLAEAGIAPPDSAPSQPHGPIPLSLSAPIHQVACPRCGSRDTAQISRFSATACKALRRCRSCAEPFEHIKEI